MTKKITKTTRTNNKILSTTSLKNFNRFKEFEDVTKNYPQIVHYFNTKNIDVSVINNFETDVIIDNNNKYIGSVNKFCFIHEAYLCTNCN